MPCLIELSGNLPTLEACLIELMQKLTDVGGVFYLTYSEIYRRWGLLSDLGGNLPTLVSCLIELMRNLTDVGGVLSNLGGNLPTLVS